MTLNESGVCIMCLNDIPNDGSYNYHQDNTPFAQIFLIF